MTLLVRCGKLRYWLDFHSPGFTQLSEKGEEAGFDQTGREQARKTAHAVCTAGILPWVGFIISFSKGFRRVAYDSSSSCVQFPS